MLIDIGAHDGVTFSNSRALMQLGWAGVMVEPSPLPLSHLVDTYAGREDVHVIGAALMLAPVPVVLWDTSGDMVSTISMAHRDVWAEGANVRHRRLIVMGCTWDTVISVGAAGRIRMVNIDVEGTNMSALRSLPIDRLSRLELICVEKDSESVRCEMIDIVAPHGFRLIHENGENMIFVRAR